MEHIVFEVQLYIKIYVLIYDWTSKKYVPLDILNMCRFHFGLSGNDCTKDETMAEEVGRLRRPASCAILRS